MQLFNLNGKVKFYLLKRYKLKFGLFKTTKQILDSSDSVLFTNKGENISFISKDSNGRIDMKVFSKYDDFGIRTECSIFNEDGYSGKFVPIYDNKGEKILEENQYGKNDNLELISQFHHNDTGKIILKNLYYPDYKLIHSIKYKLDNSGNSIEELTYDCYGKLEQKTNYDNRLDHKNNWVRRLVSHNNKLLFIEERTIEYYQ